MTRPGQSIGFFCDDLRPGGVQRTILVLAEAFLARGWRVEIILAHRHGDLLAEIPEGVCLKDLETRGYRRALRPLAKHLRAAPLDILIAATPWGNLAALGAVMLSRTGAHVMTTDVTDPDRVYRGQGWRGALLRAGARWLYPKALARIAVSGGVADAMETCLGIPRATIEVIYNPIETTPQGPASPPVHPWLADNAGPVIIAAGRLHAVKDYPTLIQAMAHLRDRDHPARLVILGEGDTRAALEEMITKLDLGARIAMPGYAANVRGAMAAADAYVMCSRAEGLGNALIEALAEEVPAVSTDCPFGPREILQNGRFGRLVSVGDPKALADALEKTLADPISFDPHDALSRFGVDEIVSQYEALVPVKTGDTH